MAKKKKAKRRTRTIITGYLEKVNAQIFDKYKQEITDMTKGHQGLYALYRKNRLYYVGLATNLRNRIKHHLADRHKGKWTHFSLYIIHKTDHIKELESLLLRIAYPEGNALRGKLKSTNLMPLLKTQVKQKIKEELEALFKGYHILKKAQIKSKKKIKTTSNKQKEKPLKGFFPGGKRIYVTYKGKDFKAWVFRSGTIKYDGKLYDSPSTAGSAVRDGRPTNGWSFWKIKDKNGNLVRLSSLRT